MKWGKRMRALQHEVWRGEYVDYSSLKKLLKWVVKEHAVAASAELTSPDVSEDGDDMAQRRAALRARTEGAFVEAVLQQLAKVSAFHGRASGAMQSRLDGYCAAAKVELSSPASDAGLATSRALSAGTRCALDSKGDAADDCSAAELLLMIGGRSRDAELVPRKQQCAHMLADIEALRSELEMLHSYCQVNTIAISKILKKHDKQTSRFGFDRLTASLGERALAEPFAQRLVARLRTTAQCLADEVAAALHDRAIGREEYACALCRQTLEQPVVLSCAHRFCLGCVSAEGCAAWAGCCPLCAAEVNPRTAPQLCDVEKGLSDFLARHFFRTQRAIASAPEAAAAPQAVPCASAAPCSALAFDKSSACRASDSGELDGVGARPHDALAQTVDRRECGERTGAEHLPLRLEQQQRHLSQLAAQARSAILGGEPGEAGQPAALAHTAPAFAHSMGGIKSLAGHDGSGAFCPGQAAEALRPLAPVLGGGAKGEDARAVGAAGSMPPFASQQLKGRPLQFKQRGGAPADGRRREGHASGISMDLSSAKQVQPASPDEALGLSGCHPTAQQGPRKRACVSCHEAKTACDSYPCQRCIRLRKPCLERPARTKRKQQMVQAHHYASQPHKAVRMLEPPPAWHPQPMPVAHFGPLGPSGGVGTYILSSQMPSYRTQQVVMHAAHMSGPSALGPPPALMGGVGQPRYGALMQGCGRLYLASS